MQYKKMTGIMNKEAIKTVYLAPIKSIRYPATGSPARDARERSMPSTLPELALSFVETE
jgi:hypothetical protein